MRLAIVFHIYKRQDIASFISMNPNHTCFLPKVHHFTVSAPATTAFPRKQLQTQHEVLHRHPMKENENPEQSLTVVRLEIWDKLFIIGNLS